MLEEPRQADRDPAKCTPPRHRQRNGPEVGTEQPVSPRPVGMEQRDGYQDTDVGELQREERGGRLSSGLLIGIDIDGLAPNISHLGQHPGGQHLRPLFN